jgi:hypothetical protein
VGDHVVQLPCDPDAFGRRHAPHPFSLLFGKALGVDLKRRSQCDTATDKAPGGERDTKEKRPYGDDVHDEWITRLWCTWGQRDPQHREREQSGVDPGPSALGALTADEVVIEHESD